MKPINLAKGFQGTQNLTTPGVSGVNLDPAVPKPGGITALLAANFDDPAVYTCSFTLAAASVLPTPTGSQGAPPVVVKPVPSSSGVRCIAICTFKVFGVPIRRVLDLGSGTSISQVAASVDVAVQDMTYTVGGPGGVTYSVSATIAEGTRPATALPPVLWQPPFPTPGSFLIAGGGGGSVGIPVPEDAGITSIEVTAVDDTVATTSPLFLVVQHFCNSTLLKAYSPVIEPGFVKLNPSCNRVVVVNLSTTDDVQISVTWGVDG
jgi:hypothetical protein